jgi:hypothetical protein
VGKAPLLEVEVEPWGVEAPPAAVPAVGFVDPDLLPPVLESLFSLVEVDAMLAVAPVALPKNLVSHSSHQPFNH